MAETIVMPRQGNSVESCLLIQWRVKEGDRVDPKTVVADVETDKASFEVEAGFAGTVLKLVRQAGDDVPVMQPIALIGAPGEALPADSAPEPVAAAVSAPASPRARRLAGAQGLELEGLAGSGPGGRILERDVATVLETRPLSTPAARDASAQSGLALPPRGTGLGGRVLSSDLVATASATPSATAFPGPKTETKIKGVRKVIADRMVQSLATSAQFTLNSSAPAVRLQELRARLKASDPALGLAGITIGDLIVYATSRTLKRFPALNAHGLPDTVVEFENVHLGIACDTPRGLMVPVLRNADSLSLKQISDETKRLADLCRAGTAKPDDLSGSTFTITNLGASGVESFTPVLNVPEVAILGVCGISPKPVQKGDSVVFVPSVGLSLTIDHKIVDGAPASKFLKALGEAIAEVDLLLAT